MEKQVEKNMETELRWGGYIVGVHDEYGRIIWMYLQYLKLCSMLI